MSPAVWFNIAQCAMYAIMAIGIMRLKLFLTPHLCVLCGLIASEQVIIIEVLYVLKRYDMLHSSLINNLPYSSDSKVALIKNLRSFGPY